MKLIKTVRLVRKQKDSVVHCDIELCLVAGAVEGYLVNLRQGRMGEEWRDSTRTPQPVPLLDATRLFDRALEAKLAQGFTDPAAPPGPVVPVNTPVNHAHTAPILLTEADRAVLQRLERGSWQALSTPRRKRTIWRIGERRLRTAVPVLIEQIERGDPMQDYCIAWAIGRCGDRGAMPAMHELHTRSKHEAVRRVALQAWLMLANDAERHAHAQALINAWPQGLQRAWADADHGALLTAACKDSALLEQLDQVVQAASDAPLARPLLLGALRAIELRGQAFAAVRHIYKMAEMRADGAVFGLLQRRFESTPHSSERYVQVGKRYQLAAYGGVTRAYLLRRGWRTLRRLGAAGDPDFVPMALAMLVQYDDRDATKPYRRTGGAIGRYGHWPLFNHLLRANAGLSHSSTGLTWYEPQQALSDGGRHEAFPELWDRHPDALFSLLLRSAAEGVHAFAVRALRDNPVWCDALPAATLRDLLRSSYAVTTQFAFDTARRRFEPDAPDASWLLAFIESGLPEALQYALDWIARAPDVYAADTDLVVGMLVAPQPPVRKAAWLLCEAALALPDGGNSIVGALLDWLDDCADGRIALVGADLLHALASPLRAATAHAPYERLLSLLRHQLAAVRVLACHWLLLHAEPASALPPSSLAALLRDTEAEVRAMGVRLFGALPDHVLLAQTELIARFASAPDASVRQAVDGVIVRLGSLDPAFGAALLPALLDGLFRSETGAGMHANLLTWINGPLARQPGLDDPDLLRRLLAARSKGAQLLGAALIDRFEARGFEVAEWAAFGCNQNAVVRQWAYAAFLAHPHVVRANLEAALRLFDSRFDDTRAFATDFFARVCPAEDWTPLLLVSLCDHPEPTAQRFGRAMISIHLESADGVDLILKLSQHPSANMQQFVSAWLETAGAGDILRLRRLEPYFLTVLSQVNRGRVARQRVQGFLRDQAMLSPEIGAFVATLFARQVVTMAIGDKAHYIDSLRAIQARYPELPAVLTVQPPPTRPGRTHA